MTERGIPTEGAPACPFVAFEDDRDGRSTAPDHRHRCFAEPRPAPRALAHQEAYCLSSAFPVCPTFQDWARREAAAARPTAAAAVPPREETPAPQDRPMPPLDHDASRPPAGESSSSTAIPPRKPQQRDWAAPPPWAGDEAPPAGAAVVGAASAGAAAGALWGDDTDAPPRDDIPRVPAKDAAHQAKASGRQPDDWGSEAQGLAGSAAHRLAGPDPDEPQPARPDRYGPDDLDDAWAAGGAAAGAYVAGSATASPSAGSRDVTPPRAAQPSRRNSATRPPTKDSSADGRPPDAGNQARRAPQPDAQELFGPAWERPRRYEAYPTLRTRMGLPGLGGVPRIALWGGLLVVAALLLFLFGPNLLGLAGQDGGGGAASPATAASEEPSATKVPATQAPPTPHVYQVAKGDTMSKIARRFGLPVAAIMAANPQIKNPNRIKVGDQITIPVPVESGSGGVSPSRGTVSGASQAP